MSEYDRHAFDTSTASEDHSALYFYKTFRDILCKLGKEFCLILKKKKRNKIKQTEENVHTQKAKQIMGKIYIYIYISVCCLGLPY